jgi:hypothetical protein
VRTLEIRLDLLPVPIERGGEAQDSPESVP